MVEEVNVAEICEKVGELLTLIQQIFDYLISDYNALLEDTDLYIESLETYGKELDKTLWMGIEQAKKEAEEQIKKQEEIMKRKSPESYIK